MSLEYNKGDILFGCYFLIIKFNCDIITNKTRKVGGKDAD